MKVGEIWNDKEDGTKVKIIQLHFDEDKRQDFLTVEELHDTVGWEIERTDFLQEYEKTTPEIV